MNNSGDPPSHFRLSTGGLMSLMQRSMRVPESEDFSIPTQIAIAFGLMWLPLTILSLAAGSFSGNDVTHPFVTDIVPQVRFLIAIPLLLAADLMIDPVTSIVVRNFQNSGIVPEADRERLEAALDKLHRARDSIWPDITIIVSALLITWMFKPGYGDSASAAAATSWMWDAQEGWTRFTAAGWWYLLISGPMFQVILFRWMWRFMIWAAFLYRLSRLPLVLRPTHPDLAGGLGYLGMAQQSFVAVFIAFTAVASSTLAHDILSGAETLRDVVPEIAILVVGFIVTTYAPLLFFSKQLFAARRLGLDEYGSLGNRLSEAFHEKWSRERGDAAGQKLLDSADPSVIADYAATYENVRSMRPVPATFRNLVAVAGILVLPFLPLTLTAFSFHDMLERLAESLV